MSTDRFYYYTGGPLNLRYRAVAAFEYLGASLRSVFQLASAPANDPVNNLYAVFRDLRGVSEDLHERYRDRFLDWQHRQKDRHGNTGVWNARVDCLDIIADKLELAGVINKGGGGRLAYTSVLVNLSVFYDAATSEFRFRHALDYYASGRDGRLMMNLKEIAPVIREVLAELAVMDFELLRASKEKHAAERSTGARNYAPGQSQRPGG
jgi:hypothetical protein